MISAARILRNTVAASALVALVSCAPVSDLRPGATAASLDVVGQRRVVALLPNAQTAERMRAAARQAGYTELDAHRLDGLNLSMLTFRMRDGVTGQDAIEELEAAVPGSTVGLNHAYRLQQDTSDANALDYAGAMMNWREGGCEARGAIGMIDTRIDTSSRSLADARIDTKTFFDGPAPAASHGTDVASVMADPDRLRNPRILGANVFGDRDAQGLLAGADALVRALDWLAEEDVHFVNLALAGPYNKLLDLAVERASARGLILVAAVGNAGPGSGALYPAGFDGVIAVTAVDAERRIYRNAVRGAHVDVAAPGVDILVRSDQGARFLTGTSIATPFVTARLAADPSLANTREVSAVRERLAATAAELGPLGRDTTYGYGLAMAADICG
ncbi:MAG: S8 family serine peptidase [Pseudomonadota bacterium]